MNYVQNRNIVLVCLTVFILAFFLSPLQEWSLILFTVLSAKPIKINTNYKLEAVSLFCIISAFSTNWYIQQLFGIVALSLVLNVGYSLIHIAMSLGSIISYFFSGKMMKFKIGRDIFLLTFTLPNLFFAKDLKSSQRNNLYMVTPLYDSSQWYSLGFIGSVIIRYFYQVPRYINLFIISICLLIQIIFSNTIDNPLIFLRGLLIYTEQNRQQQMYFLFGYLVFKGWIENYLVNYMFIGYLIFSVILWKQSTISLTSTKQSIELVQLNKSLLNEAKHKT